MKNESRIRVAGQRNFDPVRLRRCRAEAAARAAWITTGTMTVPHYFHTASLLPNGKVLVSRRLRLRLLYCYRRSLTTATRIWTVTGAIIVPRYGHTATLLPNGKVLVAGGFNTPTNGNLLAGAELYDPATGLWTGAGAMTVARLR